MSIVKLVESTVDNKKTYKFAGVFATIGQRNKNGRVYPKDLWVREVNKYQEEIRNNTVNTLMEWEHPEDDRFEVIPQNAVAKINKLWIQGDKVYGEAIVLDGPQTELLKSLIDNGVQISVSSRSVGDLDSNGNVKDFKLVTFDIVGYPSDQNATMKGIYESYQKYTQHLKESQQRKDQGKIAFLETQIKILEEKNQEMINLINEKENEMSYAERSRKLRKALNESYDDYDFFDEYDDYDDEDFYESRRRRFQEMEMDDEELEESPRRRRFQEMEDDEDDFFESRRRRPSRRRFFEDDEEEEDLEESRIRRRRFFEEEDEDEELEESRRRFQARRRFFENRRRSRLNESRRLRNLGRR